MPNLINLALVAFMLLAIYSCACGAVLDYRNRDREGGMICVILTVIYLLAAYQLFTLYRLGGGA